MTYSLDERVAVHMLLRSLEGAKIIQRLLMLLSTLVYQARPSLSLSLFWRERGLIDYSALIEHMVYWKYARVFARLP